MKNILGVDLGGTTIKLGIVSSNGKLKSDTQIPTLANTNSLETIYNNMLEGIQHFLKSQKESKIDSIGIGCPGNINPDEGKIVSGIANIPALNGFALASQLEKDLGKAAFIDNDANNAGRGEFLFGAGKGKKNFVMITLGTGIGGAIFINGELYTGAQNFAGEIGHMVIDIDGRSWNNGISGSWEAYGSASAMIIQAKNRVERGYETTLRNYYPDALNAKVIVDAAKNGDEMAMDVVRDTGKYLGVGVANLINIFNPEAIIIGGGMAAAGDILMKGIMHHAKVNSRVQAWENVELLTAKLGNRAGIMGSAALALMKTQKDNINHV